ncbi:hypothetical protein DMENIID0001_069700 [Sergentomyia squamirostris]
MGSRGRTMVYELAENGVQKTPEQCRNKFKNAKAEFEATQKHNRVSGNTRKTMNFKEYSYVFEIRPRQVMKKIVIESASISPTGLVVEFGVEYKPEKWPLIHASKRSLKAILLNSNGKYASLPLVHSTTLKKQVHLDKALRGRMRTIYKKASKECEKQKLLDSDPKTITPTPTTTIPVQVHQRQYL